jgi:DNA modification methylase
LNQYKTNQILHGDALTKLKELESESVDCICTSPPYWALRDYKVDGQIGVEKTIDEYVTNLIKVFSEAKRVLKKEGTCWIVLGDTYSGNVKAGNKVFGNPEFNKNRPSRAMTLTPEKITDGIGDKSLCMIPERFAIRMIDNNWVLRNKIIWWKPNCMPSSAKDRFTIDYEYVYFFTKSQKYYFKTQYEKSLAKWERWGGEIIKKPEIPKGSEYAIQYRERLSNPNGQETRIKRCVWSIPTKPFPEAHFAVFPEELVKQCLDAGCPSEICTWCKKTVMPTYSETRINTRKGENVGNGKSGKDIDPNKDLHNSDLSRYRQQIIRTESGLDKCNCNTGFESGIVLDPFLGAGTTALVALKNNRRFVGIELNEDYIDIAQKRIDPYLKQSKLINY